MAPLAFSTLNSHGQLAAQAGRGTNAKYRCSPPNDDLG
jgi:hypothetical protein